MRSVVVTGMGLISPLGNDPARAFDRLLAGESGISAREIGAIQITDRFSLVEVPAAAADAIIVAMRRSTIRGRRPTVRRERFTPR